MGRNVSYLHHRKEKEGSAAEKVAVTGLPDRADPMY